MPIFYLSHKLLLTSELDIICYVSVSKFQQPVVEFNIHALRSYIIKLRLEIRMALLGKPPFNMVLLVIQRQNPLCQAYEVQK